MVDRPTTYACPSVRHLLTTSDDVLTCRVPMQSCKIFLMICVRCGCRGHEPAQGGGQRVGPGRAAALRHPPHRLARQRAGRGTYTHTFTHTPRLIYPNEMAEVPTPIHPHTRTPAYLHINIPTVLHQTRIMHYPNESLTGVLAWWCRCMRVTWCASGGRVPWASWRRTVPSTATPRASHSSTRSVLQSK